MARMVLYLFFFQAEDGIRDYKVTGVQTCALPIWVPAANVVAVGEGLRMSIRTWWASAIAATLILATLLLGRARDRQFPTSKTQHSPPAVRAPQTLRSEERRVGKEWRARWAMEREK